MDLKGFACVAALALLVSSAAVADDASSDDARDALAKKDTDADSAKALEEVFQAAEKSYTLLKKGERQLTYGFDYSLMRDTRIQAVRTGQNVYSVLAQSEAQHTFTNSFTFDYGIWDNLTFSMRLPFVAKYDTERDIHAYSLGDISATLRWQPWPSRRGRPVTTLYATLGLPTGDSPYDMDVAKDVSTGNGYYSLGGGANVSYVIDPVVLYGSLGYTYNMKVDNIHQNQYGEELEKVAPGDTINFAMGMAYALSYDVSLATSYQMAYSFKNKYYFSDRSVEAPEQTSAIMNFSLGLRTSPDYIVNVNAGFGLTEDSPDVLLGLSLPLDIQGLKAQ
ncbi:transporter [Pseudomonas sp. ZM23]|uniref:Transporter n=1 Tax=Pseudomonas triclosanedens TaxID=2961893 RepID=A0ABY7A4H7_9PSED|nr:transporter [Pseudomonas triclosanedens]MCP8465690.1 transporter [Pseudomonas triclosanedens]MCP8471185.1 transporter [Pseudomonas triclosanedens]MCP8476989.1 transporter [Pseudomonas triclosanedens]WAI51901.1 transporter [Pseudomonas triclosanedens]